MEGCPERPSTIVEPRNKVDLPRPQASVRRVFVAHP